ncbi:ferrochelatase [Helicobacter anatolicus]|uniref:ferrochelatase n=1 Tax=Helicobacter anatolicus TaxID=2905874 RepID=UPI0022B90424|nr:ferrochelatase [Helicobacter anatolicus]
MLLNMGGPSHLSEVKVFLKNMFNDPYILPIKNALIRKFVGYNIIRKRLEYAKNNYRAIGGKSPMVELTFLLCQKLQKKDPERFYSYAMRYAPPYTENALQEMQQKGITSIHLFSMYPQYSTTTTLSSFDAVQKALKKLNYKPKITFTERYFDNVFYLQTITQQIIQAIANKNPSEYTLILSAHSLPQSTIDKGDPYQKECEESLLGIKKILEEKNIIFQNIILAYQSKIGKMQWIGPSTESIIKQSRDKKLLIYPLSFTIDNSETSYEIHIEYKELAQKVGVLDFIACPCLNDSELFVELILNLTKRQNYESFS